MKTKLLLTSLLITLIGGVSFAQVKIGYTNADYILSLMPEAKQIESNLSSYEKQLQNQLKSKYEEFQKKAQDYQKNAASMIDAVRQDKEKEIKNMQVAIQKFEVEAQESMTKKREGLVSPAYEKIGTAIEQVAKENGYTHIFSSGSLTENILLYAREEDNISDLILKKLGINPPAEK